MRHALLHWHVELPLCGRVHIERRHQMRVLLGLVPDTLCIVLKVTTQLAPHGNRIEFVGGRQRTQLRNAHTASLPLPPEKGHGHL